MLNESFDWKLFALTLWLLIFYQMILICEWEDGSEKEQVAGGKYTFCIQNSNRILSSILHNILSMCTKNLEGKLTITTYVRVCKATSNLWSIQCLICSQEHFDNFQGYRISFAHNLKQKELTKKFCEWKGHFFGTWHALSFLC